jgi:hypothetical protein
LTLTERALADDRWSYDPKRESHFKQFGHPREHYKTFGFDSPKVWVIASLPKSMSDKFDDRLTRIEYEPHYSTETGWEWADKEDVDRLRRRAKGKESR